MMFRIEPLTTDNWPHAYRLLAPSLALCGDTAENLIDELLDGRASLWLLRKGGDPVSAAVTEVVETPQGKFIHGRHLGGGHVDEAVAAVRAYARRIGADKIKIVGRKGWQRRLAKMGWRQAGVIMELVDGQ